LFDFVPSFRFDYENSERNLVDIQELSLIRVGEGWEFRAGVRKVFWGVTESRHLVDVINQIDFTEGLDQEEKLGQPMLNLSFSRNWGVFDIFLLPGFRERSFSGVNARPSLPLAIDEDSSGFESGAENYRLDFAFRWSHYFGDLELGLSHFSGTSREPRLLPRNQDFPHSLDTIEYLIPYYDVIDQTGIDAQYFFGDWAWKLEYIKRSGQGARFWASVVGFEKTFVGVLNTRTDLGLLVEHLYDSRENYWINSAENDLALGIRYSLNNLWDTNALLVALYDIDSEEYALNLEASTRIGTNWRLSLEASLFLNIPESTLVGDSWGGAEKNLSDSELIFFDDEDFVRLQLVRYF
tara:strand:+ start:1472 stop:2527 length:1056 start_codon:yes stop_codon:yes gene_type:complete